MTGVVPSRIITWTEGLVVPDTESVVGSVSGDDVDWDATPGSFGGDQWKQPVRCATTAAITIATALNAGDTIDGVTLVAGDRVLVKDQGSGGVANGIYVVGSTPARAADLDDDDEVLGAVVYVIDGTANGGTVWTCTNTAATVVDTDAITWAQLSGATGGGTNLGWFNVEDYGAVHDNTTDDTASIQAAIDAAEAAGGGVVYFPAGFYRVAGALQDTGRGNAQLLLPSRDVATDPELTIHLLGEFSPHQHSATATSIQVPVSGAILRSTLTTGTGALLGGWGPVGSFGNFSMTNVIVENLMFRMASNPTNSALDLSHMAGASVRNVWCDTGQYPISSITQPTTTTSYGIRMPQFDNGGYSTLYDSGAHGFYNGIEFNELASADNPSAWGCYRAFVFTDTNHAAHIRRMMAIWNKYNVVVTGEMYFDVGQIAIEHAASGWYQTTYDVDDASNYATGNLTYHVVLAGSGPSATFTKNGGTNLLCRQIGSASTVSYATPSIALGSSAAAGAASTVIRSDATIAAFDATAPTTAAFGDTAATGSAAYAARRDHAHGMPAAPGQLLIADTHSTPIVFADLILNEAQDDFLYAD